VLLVRSHEPLCYSASRELTVVQQAPYSYEAMGHYLKSSCVLVATGLCFAMASFASSVPLSILPIPLPLQMVGEDAPPPDVANGTLDTAATGVYLYPTQYRVSIPDKATRAVFEVEADCEALDGIDLFVRWRIPVTDDEDYVFCSQASTDGLSIERVVLEPADETYLPSGPLYIAVGAPSNDRVPFVVRAACTVAELPEDAASADAYVVDVPFLFCEVAEHFTLMIPDGWQRVANSDLDPSVVAGFELPRFAGQSTVARLEIASVAVDPQWDVERLSTALKNAYVIDGGYSSVDHARIQIDGQEAVRCWLVNEAEASAVELACFIHEGLAWLITLSFAPLGYAPTYEAVFDMAISSFHLLSGVEQE